ncbi:MAG: AccI family restriction endonuclease, partial [Bacteroides sp.]|nr:AccI family restriction endonuclease [Bacteroides sp.]
MTYFEQIKDLASRVPDNLVDFSLPRDVARTPTQASSNYITNKEQGDWAENVIVRAINGVSERF